MPVLKPTYKCNLVTDIKAEKLKEMGIKLVLLDVDNTITSYVSKNPIEGSIDWIKNLQKNDFLVYIVSNNFEERVSSIAKKFDLPYVSFAMKPLPKGFSVAKKALGVKSSECVVVGDQIFTDIMGANMGKMKSILVNPIEVETGFSYKLRRKLETKTRRNAKLI